MCGSSFKNQVFLVDRNKSALKNNNFRSSFILLYNYLLNEESFSGT